MQEWTSELVYRAELVLGEGPHWHPGWNRLLFVDIEGGLVGRLDPARGRVETVPVGKRVGTVVPVAGSDQLVVGLQGSIELLNFDTGARSVLTLLETTRPQNRCNDGKCDAAGRFWVGTMHQAAKREQGALYAFDVALWKKLDKRHVSNGICWSLDNRTMYYIDSFDYDVKAYDFDLASGHITNGRTVVTFRREMETPDGMCIDEAGRLWVAVWGAGAVHCYDPANGGLLGKVLVDAPHVTACAFGGEEGDQLFITTARQGLSAAALRKYPLSGSIFRAWVGTRGAPMHPFVCPNNPTT
ncbi:SMP-30/gluconolactonase/LRE family protein [Paraflavitalea pollutisoli]|uniref:SMP-30/gluconolactonase/LRE family protein n=1 Tax=Paraflavitalea pollutisoli TaxID=3034143 RepID=UPI0023ED0C11|nr:SMP-30/gluconolactonase/LRE family protein [Paraflavitalea sp. H1-2-19X]